MAHDDHPGYPEPPALADEATTLVGSLERQRATFAWKCADLTGVGLTARLGSSQLTLGRLLKHLAYMEDLNFTQALAGEALPRPWTDVDVAERSEWAFASADLDPPEALYAVWHDAVARSRTVTQRVLLDRDPGVTFEVGRNTLTVRRLLVDMIEEYGRHTGHADLLREAVDGRVGEDGPGPAYPYSLASGRSFRPTGG